MTPTVQSGVAPVPPPSYHRSVARSLHLHALYLVEHVHLLHLCAFWSHHHRTPPLPAGPGGRPRTYTDASMLLMALLRTLWRLTYEETQYWLQSWPALAQACGFPMDAEGHPRVPSKSQQSKRLATLARPPARPCSCSWCGWPSKRD